MTTSESLKFCKDCRWCWGPGEGLRHQSEQWTCESPQNTNLLEISLVTGEHSQYYKSCEEARKNNILQTLGSNVLVNTRCGSYSQWFEPKETIAQKLLKESQPRLPKDKSFEIGKDI